VVVVAGFLLSMIGNWVHLSFLVMAPVVAVMWMIAWWASPSIDLKRRLALAASGVIGLAVGCVLSPYGVALTIERSQVVAEICRGLITEWMSLIDAAKGGELRWIPMAAVALVVVLACGVWMTCVLRRNGRFDPRVRLLLPLIVVAIPVTFAGLGALRFIVVGMLVILPVAAAAATSFVDGVHRRQNAGNGFWARPRVVDYTSGRFWTIVMVGIALVFLPITMGFASKGAKPPEAVLAEVLPEGCSLFSDASAGPVILTRPDVRVWLDGRADFYGREHLIATARIYAGLDPIPREADCVMLNTVERLTAPLAQELDDDGAWDRIASLDGFGVWVRS